MPCSLNSVNYYFLSISHLSLHPHPFVTTRFIYFSSIPDTLQFSPGGHWSQLPRHGAIVCSYVLLSSRCSWFRRWWFYVGDPNGVSGLWLLLPLRSELPIPFPRVVKITLLLWLVGSYTSEAILCCLRPDIQPKDSVIIFSQQLLHYQLWRVCVHVWIPERKHSKETSPALRNYWLCLQKYT